MSTTGGLPVNTQPRDWFRILRDLTAAGVGYAKVARKCNRNSSTVANWANGSEPKESDARVVLALYAKHCPQKYLEHQRQFDIRVAAAPAPAPAPVLPPVTVHPTTAVAREIARMFSLASFRGRKAARRQPPLPAAPDARQRSLFEAA
jgi:hypothetical protein